MVDNLFSLMINIGNITIEINRLLGIRCIEGNKQSKSRICKRLKNITIFFNKQEYKEMEFEINSLIFLIGHLKILETSNPDLLDKYRKIILHDISNEDLYYGTRFEVSIAATFQEKQLIFEKSEPPLADFYINTHDVYVECVSRQLKTEIPNKNRSLLSSLRRTLKQKSYKEYANKNTALFVDITNVYQAVLLSEDFIINRDVLLKELSHQISISKYGSIVFFVYMHNVDNNSWGQNYIRIDTNDIDEKLLNFLDVNFPMDEIQILNFGVSNRV